MLQPCSKIAANLMDFKFTNYSLFSSTHLLNFDFSLKYLKSVLFRESTFITKLCLIVILWFFQLIFSFMTNTSCYFFISNYLNNILIITNLNFAHLFLPELILTFSKDTDNKTQKKQVMYQSIHLSVMKKLKDFKGLFNVIYIIQQL